MKVLMLTCQYMPDVYGGAEKQCWRLSKALLRQGASIRLITSSQNRRKVAPDDLPIFRIYTGKPPDLLGRWLPFSIYWFVRVVVWGVTNKSTFDVIHCHQGKFGGFVGCVLGACVKKPVLIKVGNSEQAMDFLCLRRKFFVGPLMFHYILRRQPWVVAISEVIAGNLARAGFKRIIKIPNGIDIGAVDAPGKPNQSRPAASAVNLFYHGRLEPIKRVHLLVEAMAVINDPDIHLHIVGDGSERRRINEDIRRLSLQNRITLHGCTHNALPLISAWDIFVNASRVEGFSNSLLEAMQLGKVMVSTQVSGAAEVIDVGVNGFIVRGHKPRDIAEYIAKAIALHRSAPSTAQQASQKKLSEVFDIDLVAKKYMQLYGDLA